MKLNNVVVSAPVNSSNPAAYAAAVPSSQGCNPVNNKPNVIRSQFNMIAVVTGATTVYLPSFDQIAELISGRPTLTEGETAALTNSSIVFIQELSQYGFSPSVGGGAVGTASGEYIYDNTSNTITGQVALTSAAAFMRRLAQTPYLINKIQMTTAESTSIITTLYGSYGNLGGSTAFTRQLNNENMVSGSNTVYTNYDKWWLTGGTQLRAVANAAGTYRWTFFVGGYGDNYNDISTND